MLLFLLVVYIVRHSSYKLNPMSHRCTAGGCFRSLCCSTHGDVCHSRFVVLRRLIGYILKQNQNLFLLSSLMGAWCHFRTGNSGSIMLSFCSMKPVSVRLSFFYFKLTLRWLKCLSPLSSLRHLCIVSSSALSPSLYRWKSGKAPHSPSLLLHMMVKDGTHRNL